MNFADEPYVCVYKRRTATMAVVGWQARAVLRELFLVVDRAGVLDLDDESPVDAITAVIGDIPSEVIEEALRRLQQKGCIQINGRFLVIPKFREAQETPKSDKLRAKESRERRRSDAMAAVTKRDAGVRSNGDTNEPDGHDAEAQTSGGSGQDEFGARDVTKRDEDNTERDANVTPGHTASHGVTQIRSDQNKTDPPLTPPVRKRAGRTPEKPVELPPDWQPTTEQIQALATRFGATERDVARQVRDFRWYWREGKGTGKRRGPKGWELTFAKRIAALATSGELFAGMTPNEERSHYARHESRQHRPPGTSPSAAGAPVPLVLKGIPKPAAPRERLTSEQIDAALEKLGVTDAAS